jgi:hypothetical protein
MANVNELDVWSDDAPVITAAGGDLDFNLWSEYGAPVLEIDESSGTERRRAFIF